MFNNKFENIIDSVTNRQVSYMEEKLKEIKWVTDELEEGLQNNRYSKIISALTDIEQSFLESDEERKILIQLIAQTKLNEGIDSILREYLKVISFFAEWDERPFNERVFGAAKYSEKNIEKKLNQLCNHYVYLKKGIKTLINLMISQGIEKENLKDLIEKMNGLDELIEINKIYNWLPIENEINSWQHKLLYGEKYDSRFSKSNEDSVKIEKADSVQAESKESLVKKIRNKKKEVTKCIIKWRYGNNEM